MLRILRIIVNHKVDFLLGVLLLGLLFNDIIEDVLRREGGYVNHPNDKGGPTNMGITKKTLERYLNRKVSIDELRNLQKETAIEIYDRKYFSGPRINTLPEGLQPIMVDTSILYGPVRAIKFAQKIVNEAGFGPITVDGILGPVSREKIKESYYEMDYFFINAMVEERIMFCKLIVLNNPKQKVFLKGWINRANEFRIDK